VISVELVVLLKISGKVAACSMMKLWLLGLLKFEARLVIEGRFFRSILSDSIYFMNRTDYHLANELRFRMLHHLEVQLQRSLI
jgi:hypothetical protein